MLRAKEKNVNEKTEFNEELRTYIRRNVIVLIYDYLEKTRRFWAWKFQHLIANGLEAKNTTEVIVGKNTIQLIISVYVPEGFINESVRELYRRKERMPWLRSMYGEEIKSEEQIKKEEEEEKELVEEIEIEGT